MDGKDTKYKLQQNWTLLGQEILEFLKHFISVQSFPYTSFLNLKPSYSKTYHSIREEENGVQRSKEKSGLLCAGEQMVAAPDLQQHKSQVSPHWYLSVLLSLKAPAPTASARPHRALGRLHRGNQHSVDKETHERVCKVKAICTIRKCELLFFFFCTDGAYAAVGKTPRGSAWVKAVTPDPTINRYILYGHAHS